MRVCDHSINQKVNHNAEMGANDCADYADRAETGVFVVGNSNDCLLRGTGRLAHLTESIKSDYVMGHV